MLNLCGCRYRYDDTSSGNTRAHSPHIGPDILRSGNHDVVYGVDSR